MCSASLYYCYYRGLLKFHLNKINIRKNIEFQFVSLIQFVEQCKSAIYASRFAVALRWTLELFMPLLSKKVITFLV